MEMGTTGVAGPDALATSVTSQTPDDAPAFAAQEEMPECALP